MYEGLTTKQPEHLEIATKMASVIIERFNVNEQNDCVKLITNLVKERREIMIKEMEDNLSRIRASYQQLRGEPLNEILKADSIYR